jgi:hypothetical protein
MISSADLISLTCFQASVHFSSLIPYSFYRRLLSVVKRWKLHTAPSVRDISNMPLNNTSIVHFSQKFQAQLRVQDGD